ncbi:hypothetical protein MTO96_038469 [Rhipicephalus appendiculatus]
MTSTPCVQPALSPNGTLVNTDALDFDELTSVAGPPSTPPSHVAAGAAPAENALAAVADAACVTRARTPHVMEPCQLRRKTPPLPHTHSEIITRPQRVWPFGTSRRMKSPEP